MIPVEFMEKEQSIDFKIEYFVLIITLVGGYFRFTDLGFKPLFVDEALFGLWVNGNFPMQEWLPLLLAKLMPNTEAGLRFLFALSGTLTIPAIYLVVKNNKIMAAIIVAIFPLFIFWSRMARPYAMAGLFLVLGWRWFWFYIPAMLCTPISAIGVKLYKQKWFIPFVVLIIGVFLFLLRPDTERFTNNAAGISMLEYSSRFWYLPALAILLYLFEFKLKYLQIGVLIVVSYLFLTSIKTINDTEPHWYKREVRFADWRGLPPVDYSTSLLQGWYYSGVEPQYLRNDNIDNYLKDLDSGKTLILGVDYIANYNISSRFFFNDFTIWKENSKEYPIQEFLKRYLSTILFYEKVILLKAYKRGNKIIMEWANV